MPNDVPLADGIIPDEDATVLDVVMSAEEKGLMVVTNGHQILVSNKKPHGYSRFGCVFRDQFFGKPS